MSDVIALSSVNNNDSEFQFMKLRESFGLTRNQAATAMGTSVATIEYWELNPLKGPDELTATNTLQDFVRENGISFSEDKNLLYGHYPLKIARDLLSLSIDEIAKRYGYKKDAWQSFESNRRPLKREIICEIESDVRSHFNNLCNTDT